MAPMRTLDLFEWLVENGGPVIHYRTVTELAENVINVDVESLKCKLLDSEAVKSWLDKLQSHEVRVEQTKKGLLRSNFFHGGRDINIEVVLPKLSQLGIRAGMTEFDDKTVSWREVLVEAQRTSFEDIYLDDDQFLRQVYLHYDRQIVLGASLALAGYYDDTVQRHLRDRLNLIHKVIKQVGYDIYENPSEHNIRPKEWRNHILKWKLYEDGNIRLPFIHDICSFAVLYEKTSDKTVKDKIDTIIQWVLQPNHQSLLYNYGYIRCPHGLGKSVGWKMNLPGYFGFNAGDFNPTQLVIRCWMLSHFRSAINHPWFIESLKHLESFMTKRGTYVFPSQYLTERKGKGYWILGAYMGLGENRRRRVWGELESTFWMMKIKKNSKSLKKTRARKSLGSPADSRF